MWDLVPYIAAGLTTVFTGAICVYYWYPSLIITYGFKMYRFRSGMKVKFVGDPDFVFCYGEKGQKSANKPSILFIHGFTASKDQWLGAFKMLPSNLHLIALDSPGHGATSTPHPTQDISLEYSLEAMRKFVELVGLADKPFHIIGASLGGCLAGLFAATYPDLVERVTMICPGMKCPEHSEFQKQIQKAIEIGAENVQIEHCSLLPRTTHELKLMFDSCIFSEMNISQQILKGVIDLRLPKYDYYLRVFRALATDENMTVLERNCHRITMPSQIIWGENDKIVHCSGAEVLRKKMPNCQDVTIIERCGHSIDLDRPGMLVKAILNFRKNLSRQ